MTAPGSNNTVDSVSGDDVRRAMRLVPSAVTVVTIGGEEPDGITIGSFVSASLEPPLVTFNVQRSARIHDRLIDVDLFAIHVLSEEQGDVSEIFADPELDGHAQLARVPHDVDEDGVPDIRGAVARISCTVEATYPAGDHSIILGRIVAIQAAGEGRALVYLNRGYRSVEASYEAKRGSSE